MKSFVAFLISVFSVVGFAAEKPTAVLIHGALFTSQGWFLVQSELQNAGYNVVTIDMPGRAGDKTAAADIFIQTASNKVCSVLRHLGDVVLVGHSQGGAVITQTAGDCPNKVKGLLYVAAVIPGNTEIAFAGLDPAVDVNFAKCATPNPKTGYFELNRKGPLEKSFFADLRERNSDLADSALATMVSEPMGIGTTALKFSKDQVDPIPKWYLETTEDQVLSIGTQRKYQKTVKLQKVFKFETSHCPFLSQPKETAAVIAEVLEAAAKP